LTSESAETPAIPPVRYVNIGGLRVAYREAGRGPPLVLLHGFLCDSRCWRPQLAGLSDRFRVVAWDAPGAGASSDPSGAFTTTDYAHCLAGFLDQVGVEQADVLGLSWGGILAQEFCRLYSNRLRRLILAGSYAGWRGSLPAPVWQERLATCLADAVGDPAAVVAKFLPGVFTDDAPQHVREEFGAIVAEFHPVGFQLMALSSAEMDTRALLPHIGVPTLLLWGDADRRSPLSVAEQLRASIPGAELAVIAGAGHLSNMEQADAFDAEVRRFCAEPGVA
jgi:pimeloyl-ACP methyl ester carboxylesterase